MKSTRTKIQDALKQASADSGERLMRAKEASVILGTRRVLLDCEKGGWIRAVVRRKRLTLYYAADVFGCLARIRQRE